jgi:hypothetical protein
MLIGHGILNWNGHERVTDRYGAVNLSENNEYFIFPGLLEGERGLLYAIVKETRESSHCGDLFRGLFPSVPELDEKIILGSGTLFYSGIHVGIKPDDGRESDWLNVKNLYKLHEQTVDLHFEPFAQHSTCIILQINSASASENAPCNFSKNSILSSEKSNRYHLNDYGVGVKPYTIN